MLHSNSSRKQKKEPSAKDLKDVEVSHNTDTTTQNASEYVRMCRLLRWMRGELDAPMYLYFQPTLLVFSPRLKKNLPKWIPRGTHVYLATNEDIPNFFDALKELYLTSTLADFRNLWAEGSNWWNDTSQLFDASNAEPFDGMMEVSMRGKGG